MDVIATLTEIRGDGMQKWERDDLPKQDHLRYIWLPSYHSIKEAGLGSRASLVFVNGTRGAVRGHWALWRVKEIIEA